MVHIVTTTAVLATMMMGLHWLLLPVTARRRWRVSSHATRWCAFFNSLLHRTQLLRLFFMFMSMLSLLWYRNMMMMFSDSTLAPALRRMLDECTSIVNLRDRKYRPLILPQNKGDQLKTEHQNLNFLALHYT